MRRKNKRNCLQIKRTHFAYQCKVDSIIGIGPKDKHEFLASLPGVKYVIEDYQNCIETFKEIL